MVVCAKKNRPDWTQDAPPQIVGILWYLPTHTLFPPLIPACHHSRKGHRTANIWLVNCVQQNQGIFKNSDGRITRNIRRHLTGSEHHKKIYDEFVQEFKLKGWDSVDSTGEEFSPKVFMDLLLWWIVVDDQSINVVECLEFCDVLAYIGLNLAPGDIPHCMKLLELIFAQFESEFSNIKAELQVGRITLDNASNNNTMMRALEHMLQGTGVEFSAEGNQIRCFPHIINIAVKTSLSRLTYTELQGFDDADGVNPEDTVEFMPSSMSEEIPTDYLIALKVDLIAKVRKLVNACRASGKWCSTLQKTIIEICEADLKAKEEAGVKITEDDEENVIKVVVLLRDVDTRWSSVFLMIDHMLSLYPLPENEEICSLLLKNSEITVLNDIRLYLKTFHVIQEIVSSEKTPTLADVLPLYERLILNLKTLKIVLPKLSHMIDSSLGKIYEYVDKARSMHMYAFALFINPTSKLTWIEEQWNTEDISNAKTAILDVMTKHRTSIRHKKIRTKTPGQVTVDIGGSDAAWALQSGFDYLDQFTESLQTLSRTSSASLSLTSSNGSLSEIPEELEQVIDTSLGEEDCEIQAIAEDCQLAEAELRSWVSDGILKGSVDLIRFWDDKLRQRDFPSLFRLALDVLPAQASAVPCERVFSSSKETDTDKRFRMSTVLMEVLQILKHLYSDDRLDFCKSWVAKSSEMGEENNKKYCTETDGFRDGITTTDLEPDELREILMKGLHKTIFEV
ncbi:hypothetical protein D9758_008770 [Tetrapyrgos nigripes]|uniref:HAT C-terminal dimerisation domain-containing protein n=1 Tax=Tetrapyrgos nigripes TaxID=182062 RepID=A0A8H5FX95_9AGAR|nr:hypothetical protein D9758_008770 [Tetrapyrgos nigripes]